MNFPSGQRFVSSDTWVYNATGSGWRFVAGIKNAGASTLGTLDPRVCASSWSDSIDGFLYIFGGWGFGSSEGRSEYN